MPGGVRHDWSHRPGGLVGVVADLVYSERVSADHCRRRLGLGRVFDIRSIILSQDATAWVGCAKPPACAGEHSGSKESRVPCRARPRAGKPRRAMGLVGTGALSGSVIEGVRACRSRFFATKS